MRRVGQCVITAAGASCFDALGPVTLGAEKQALAGPEESIRLGSLLRFFGDGQQTSKRSDPALAGAAGGRGRPRRLWRVPVMDGEFVVDDRCGIRKAVAGGNFRIRGTSAEATLAAAERAVAAIRRLPEVILPFPGGIVRSGSKVGSKYRKLIASTNSPYCPTIRGVVETALPEGVESVLEVVIDGLSVEAVGAAVAAGARAACGDGVVRIGAGGSETVIWSRELVNIPVQAFITGNGKHVVTCDTWAKLGYEHALVIYGEQGLVVGDYNLEALLSPDEIATSVSHTATTRRWLQDAAIAFDPGETDIVIELQWGKTIRVALATGRIETAQ